VTADPRWGEIDRYLFGEGRHLRLWEHLGAHPGFDTGLPAGVAGTWFAVWAPSAKQVTVIGDFNGFDRSASPLTPVYSTGVWSGFVPGASVGQCYKFAVTGANGRVSEKADPMAFATEVPPKTASVISTSGGMSTYEWKDDAWMVQRKASNPWSGPMSIYEVHLPSWRGAKTYVEFAHELSAHVKNLGFTHVELMPVAEHPYGPSWGYQVTSYYAPTSRFGSPDEFRMLVDHLHAEGIGVIVDWVPAHFPKDEWALAKFDGSALYEHADPRQGEQPDWGTLVFNFGRTEVKNFLVANALFWFDQFHIDGLRVDAVASMLYLDYSREQGQWIPNEHGGRENLEAVSFMKELNTAVHGEHPGVLMIAEESTAWPSVSRPVEGGGLGFGFKWNMGWMHDTLQYFGRDAIHRQHHHSELTFGLLYAFTENFVLPLSHDEVVHGKGSLINRMPGDAWQKRANLRAMYAWMFAHPGKQLLFMGAEFGQWSEWNSEGQLDWWLLNDPAHAGIQELVRSLHREQLAHPSLWERDFEPEGFGWVVSDDAGNNVFAFGRFGSSMHAQPVVCIANLSPVPREGHAITLPAGGTWREVLNTDAVEFGGGGIGNGGWVEADSLGHATVTLPPLGVLWLAHQ
jgi:1,4-alpha-glucan branching enzyme